MSPEQRIDHLTRARDGVWTKLQRVYGVAEGDCLPRRSHLRKLNEGIIDDLTLPAWYATRDDAIARSAASPKAGNDIDLRACMIMEDYLRIAHLRRHIYNLPEDAVGEGYRTVFAPHAARRQVVDLYMNHTTKLAEAQLRAAGLDAHSAHAINGRLIRNVHNLYAHTTFDFEAAKVRPDIGSIRGKSTAEIDTRIATIEGYGPHMKRLLEKAHRNAQDPQRER